MDSATNANASNAAAQAASAEAANTSSVEQASDGQTQEVKKDTSEPKEEKKRTANERLRERYPDSDPQTDEDWEGLRNRYMDDSEASEKERADFEAEVNDLIASDKDLALILNDMLVNKLPFRAALARSVDLEGLTPQQGEDDYEAWDKAYKERIDQNRKMAERQKEIDSNEEKSFENIDKFCQERGYDEDAKNAIVDFINEIFDSIVMKNVSPELLAKIDKARTYDSAVRDAALEGEVKGRNANIEAQRVEEMEKEEGDGIPAPRAASSTPLSPKEDPDKGRFTVEDFWSGVGGNSKWK